MANGCRFEHKTSSSGQCLPQEPTTTGAQDGEDEEAAGQKGEGERSLQTEGIEESRASSEVCGDGVMVCGVWGWCDGVLSV